MAEPDRMVRFWRGSADGVSHKGKDIPRMRISEFNPWDDDFVKAFFQSIGSSTFCSDKEGDNHHHKR